MQHVVKPFFAGFVVAQFLNAWISSLVIIVAVFIWLAQEKYQAQFVAGWTRVTTTLMAWLPANRFSTPVVQTEDPGKLWTQQIPVV